MEQEIIINQLEVQEIPISNISNIQTITVSQNNVNEINVNQLENQEININNIDNTQYIGIGQHEITTGVIDVKVNGISVVEDDLIAYVIVPTKLSQLQNDVGFIKNEQLSSVATSGNYNDLSNKPTIPDVSNFITKDVNNLTNYTLSSELSEVATTGDYNDLSNKPTIPDVSNFITKNVDDLTNYTKTDDLSVVATTNSYEDLSDLPDLDGKQDVLVSGENIKTINNTSLLGSGNINISGGGLTPEQIETLINNAILENNKATYHIGKIIIETTNTNPATYLGFGTWILWGSGRVPVGVDTTQTEFNTVEQTGGEKTHALTINEMPSHSHSASSGESGWHAHTFPTWHVSRTGTGQSVEGWGNKQADQWHSTDGAGTHTHDIYIGNNGGNQAHNNIQPYITCYMWKRIA